MEYDRCSFCMVGSEQQRAKARHTLKKSLKGQRRTGAGADAALKAPWPAGDRFEASSFD